jgi:Winged helix-turn-helix DNA-binding
MDGRFLSRTTRSASRKLFKSPCGDSGSTLNEVDGNLTLALQPSGLIELGWQGKFRGFHFEPQLFRIDKHSSPDIIDVEGRQIAIPIMFPATIEEAASREAAIASREMHLLKAIADNPGASMTELAAKAEIPRGSVTRTLKRLGKERPKLIQEGLGKWTITKAENRPLRRQNRPRRQTETRRWYQNETVNSKNARKINCLTRDAQPSHRRCRLAVSVFSPLGGEPETRQTPVMLSLTAFLPVASV